jgi:hypothetical protein
LKAWPDEVDSEDAKKRREELRARVPRQWLIVLGREPIENCELLFTFRCPLKWEKLEPTNLAGVRFCHACQKAVYHCDTIEEARDHASAGDCVAVDAGLTRSPDDLLDPTAVYFSQEIIMGELAD